MNETKATTFSRRDLNSYQTYRRAGGAATVHVRTCETGAKKNGGGHARAPRRIHQTYAARTTL
jgi:hypothetical protein